MISTQNKQMAQFFESMTERMSRPGLDLATIRDVYENLHLAAAEPEGVCYAEVDIDGLPALWCLPTDCNVNRVLLHAHGGGTETLTASCRNGQSRASTRPCPDLRLWVLISTMYATTHRRTRTPKLRCCQNRQERGEENLIYLLARPPQPYLARPPQPRLCRQLPVRQEQWLGL